MDAVLVRFLGGSGQAIVRTADGEQFSAKMPSGQNFKEGQKVVVNKSTRWIEA